MSVACRVRVACWSARAPDRGDEKAPFHVAGDGPRQRLARQQCHADAHHEVERAETVRAVRPPGAHRQLRRD
eukprot:4594954-Prymnesium_polylepis.1